MAMPIPDEGAAVEPDPSAVVPITAQLVEKGDLRRGAAMGRKLSAGSGAVSAARPITAKRPEGQPQPSRSGRGAVPNRAG